MNWLILIQNIDNSNNILNPNITSNVELDKR
jgi:hypothetical protein